MSEGTDKMADEAMKSLVKFGYGKSHAREMLRRALREMSGKYTINDLVYKSLKHA